MEISVIRRDIRKAKFRVQQKADIRTKPQFSKFVFVFMLIYLMK